MSSYSVSKFVYFLPKTQFGFSLLSFRECPVDLKEGIASLIFAAPRCSEIPELGDLKDIFEKKYGRDFVTAATELRPTCGVNRMVRERESSFIVSDCLNNDMRFDDSCDCFVVD